MAPAEMGRNFRVGIGRIHDDDVRALGKPHDTFIERAVAQLDIGQIGD